MFNNYEINLNKYNASEKNNIRCLLSSLDDISLENFEAGQIFYEKVCLKSIGTKHRI